MFFSVKGWCSPRGVNIWPNIQTPSKGSLGRALPRPGHQCPQDPWTTCWQWLSYTTEVTQLSCDPHAYPGHPESPGGPVQIDCSPLSPPRLIYLAWVDLIRNVFLTSSWCAAAIILGPRLESHFSREFWKCLHLFKDPTPSCIYHLSSVWLRYFRR